MIKQEIRKPKVQKRHQALRVKLAGTTEFPRLAVYRSTKHIYAQLIDDEKLVTSKLLRLLAKLSLRKLWLKALNALYSIEAVSYITEESLL